MLTLHSVSQCSVNINQELDMQCHCAKVNKDTEAFFQPEIEDIPALEQPT